MFRYASGLRDKSWNAKRALIIVDGVCKFRATRSRQTQTYVAHELATARRAPRDVRIQHRLMQNARIASRNKRQAGDLGALRVSVME